MDDGHWNHIGLDFGATMRTASKEIALRNQSIYKQFLSGKGREELAIEFLVCKGTINNVIAIERAKATRPRSRILRLGDDYLQYKIKQLRLTIP